MLHGVRNIVPVIKAVMGSLAHKSLDRLPSRALLCQMMVECLTLAHAQLGEELSNEERDYYALQTDGTTKYGEHFATYNVATADGIIQSWSPSRLFRICSGLSHHLEEIMEDLDIVQNKLGTSTVSSKIVSKLKNAMSDCHAAEKPFNELLSEYRVGILPDVVEGWSNMNDTEKRAAHKNE